MLQPFQHSLLDIHREELGRESWEEEYALQPSYRPTVGWYRLKLKLGSSLITWGERIQDSGRKAIPSVDRADIAGDCV